jgi:hypothetical protein
MLTQSGYIRVLREKTEDLERNFASIRNPQPIIKNEEYRLLVKEGAGLDTLPHSIIKWNKKILMGCDCSPMIKRLRPILALLNLPQ